MADNPTPNFGGQLPAGSPFGQWTPTQPKRRSGSWLAIALAAIATVVAVAALVVAITRPAASSSSATGKTPAYSAAETAAAQQQLCDTYKLVARAVGVDTNGNDKALARVADTNGALMLTMAMINPALDANHRDAARALATAYGTVTAMSNGTVASDADYQAAVDDVIAKDAAMKKVCGGG